MRVISRWTRATRTRHGRGVAGLLLMMLVLVCGGPARAAGIVSLLVEPDRLLMRFDRPVGSVDAALARGGRRILLDLPGVEPDLPPARGGFARASGATDGDGGARVELDLAARRVIADGSLSGDGRRLTLRLAAADAATAAMAGLAAPLHLLPFRIDLAGIGSGGARPRYHVSQAVPTPARATPLPRIAGAAGRPLVVIDPGHGGADPGAINPATGLREKDVTLRIARAVRDALAASGRVRVALTRDDDRFLVLRERFGIARRLHADLFISLHCDSVGGVPGADTASGASIYTLSEVASDKEAARLAARENKADVLSGVDLGGAGADVSSILIDLAQRETMNASADFARLLGREAAPLVPLRPQFHRMASLMVLKAPDMPSVLLETGYLSNPRDAAFIDSDAGRRRIARAIERAVEVHFARRLAAR